MPRIARLTYHGGFYHIYNRGLNKSPIFYSQTDYRKLFDKLSSLAIEGDWIIYAYCFMPNHYHMLVEENNIPIAKLIGRQFTSYCVYFNKKHKRQGPLFQDRFKSKLIQKNNYFMEVSRYIHLNPFNSGLVENPQDYEYSSLKEYTGQIPRKIINLGKLSTLLGENDTRIKDYLKFVNDGMKKNLDKFDPFLNKSETVGSRTFSSHRKRRIISDS